MSDPERTVKQYTERVKRRAQVEADRRGEQWREQLGDVVVDATKEYFPEQYRRRQRKRLGAAFVGGLATGVAVGLWGRRLVERERGGE